MISWPDSPTEPSRCPSPDRAAAFEDRCPIHVAIGRALGQPNTSALFILVRTAQSEKVLAEMSRFRGRVIRSSLSPEQEGRLQAALTEPDVSMPGSAGASDVGATPHPGGSGNADGS